MFGSVGFPELMFIFVIALLLFGPRQLPNIGKSLGRALAEFKRASNEFKRTIEEEVVTDEIKSAHRELRETAATVEQVVSDKAAGDQDEESRPAPPAGAPESSSQESE